MTGNQLERFARAHRQVSQRRRRCGAGPAGGWPGGSRTTGRYPGTFRLPPLAGRGAAQGAPRCGRGPGSLARHPGRKRFRGNAGRRAAGDGDVVQPGRCAAGRSPRRSWPQKPPPRRTPRCTRSSCTSAPTPSPTAPGAWRSRPGRRSGNAGARPASRRVTRRTRRGATWKTARPLSVSTAQMLGCAAALSWMRHGAGGAILDLGRRRRRPNAALRRAARERDHCRCRFPGCESRRVDLHHITYWSHGGRTSLGNLISLCKAHHTLVHERGYLIAAPPGGGFAFYRPDGTALPASPALPPRRRHHRQTATTPASRPRRSSRRGTASGSTWTTPSTPAWPTPAPRRKSSSSKTRPTTPRFPAPQMGRRTRRLDAVPAGTHRRNVVARC